MEEEESWHKDEAKRVVVFNAQEIKDWQQRGVELEAMAEWRKKMKEILVLMMVVIVIDWEFVVVMLLQQQP